MAAKVSEGNLWEVGGGDGDEDNAAMQGGIHRKDKQTAGIKGKPEGLSGLDI